MYFVKNMAETLRKEVYGGQVENRDFLMEVSLTKSPLFTCGDTVILPGGREFRYAKSNGAAVMKPNMGIHFTETGLVAYTAWAVSKAVGERVITIPAATHVALTKDALAGGYVIAHCAADSTKSMTYEIVGNDACDANVAFNVTLDMPLGVAITAGVGGAEVFGNPWESMSQVGSSVLPYAGAPVNYIAKGAYYFWVQTKGVKFVDPQTGVGADNGGIVAYWRHDGSLQKGETALAVTVAADDTIQQAGTVIAGSAAGNGPLVNLLGY